jgi:hypothetical protein
MCYYFLGGHPAPPPNFATCKSKVAPSSLMMNAANTILQFRIRDYMKGTTTTCTSYNMKPQPPLPSLSKSSDLVNLSDQYLNPSGSASTFSPHVRGFVPVRAYSSQQGIPAVASLIALTKRRTMSFFMPLGGSPRWRGGGLVA